MSKKNSKFGKKIVFVVDVAPYKQECIVVVNGKVKDALDFLKKQKTENAKRIIEHVEKDIEEYEKSVGDNEGCVFHELPVGYIMMLRHLDSWVDTASIVSHESLHLVNWVFNRAGLKLTPDSEEAYTYQLANVVGQILRKIY